MLSTLKPRKWPLNFLLICLSSSRSNFEAKQHQTTFFRQQSVEFVAKPLVLIKSNIKILPRLLLVDPGSHLVSHYTPINDTLGRLFNMTVLFRAFDGDLWPCFLRVSCSRASRRGSMNFQTRIGHTSLKKPRISYPSCWFGTPPCASVLLRSSSTPGCRGWVLFTSLHQNNCISLSSY